MKYYNDFFAVEDWEVVDTKVCRFYNDDETLFGAVCVKIGVLHILKGNHMEETDILRWISNGEYLRLRENSGVIVF